MGIEYTLGNLLADPHLNLELLTGSADMLETPLYGAHSIEIDNPSQWLDPGWLMLTMGVCLRQRPSEQRQLIVDLQKLGAAALGFGVGVAFKTVPAALIEEAAARNFPVIMVPAETKFQEISRVVFQSIFSSEAQTYTRLSALQQNLMRAFADADPIDSTLRRLGRFSNSVVAVIGADGTVHASTGTLPYRQIAEGLVDRPLLAPPLLVEEWEVVAAPLSAWQSSQPVSLVLASRQAATSRSLTRTLLDVAVPIFEALGRFTVANRRHDQALRKAMLENALGKKLSDVEASQFEEHLVASGVTARDGFHCVVTRAEESEVALLDNVEEVLAGVPKRLPAIYSRRHDEIVLVVSTTHATIAHLRSVIGAQRFERLRTGVGRAVGSAHELAVSHRDATIVLRYLGQEHAGAALTFDDLDLASQLFAEVPADRVAAKVEQISELLLSNPIQLDALRAYFAACQDVQVAAKSIFVHPNTLRYRLERFEKALGRSLRDPAIIASLHYVLSLMQDRTPEALTAGTA